MKKKNKLEKAWVSMMIDLVLGPHLMMLGMREPEAAEKLSGILVRMVNDMNALDKYKNDKRLFIIDVEEHLWSLYNNYRWTKMEKYLKEGMPARPMILNPNAVPGPRRRQ